MLAVGILLLSSIIAVNLLFEKSYVVIQLDGDNFKILDIPYIYTVKEGYILLFSGFFGGMSLAQILLSLGLQSSARTAAGSAAQVPTLDIQAEKVLEGSYEVSLENPLLRNPSLPGLTLIPQRFFCEPLKEMREKLLN